MGCINSKTAQRRHNKSRFSYLSRSYTVHEPSCHEAFSPTRLSSFNRASSVHHHPHITIEDSNDNNDNSNSMMKSKQLSMTEDYIRATSWSSGISEGIPKFIPKTPTGTPPNEPLETINTSELMEGLDDDNLAHDDVAIPNSSIPHDHLPKPKSEENNKASTPKPELLQMTHTESNAKSSIAYSDPEIISTLRQALEELSPKKPLENENLVSIRNQQLVSREDTMKDGKKVKVESVMMVSKCPPGGENRAVIYFTSLRGVRKTYEDCCHVRVILNGFGIRVDERDVSMDNGFREELKELLGNRFGGGLPRVFVKGRYIGGAKEVRHLNEEGELEKILKECEVGEAVNGGCDVCGDVRFVTCERCSGSCKIYNEEEEEEEEGSVNGDSGFQRCPDCNENGIVRCPVCCAS